MKLSEQFRRGAAATAIAVVTVCIVVLALELVGAYSVRFKSTSSIRMVPATAIILVLLGAALFLHTRQAVPRRVTDGLAIAALACLVIGLLSPFVGIWRPAYNTLVALALLGAALLAIDRRPRLAQRLTLVAALIALLTTAGHTYGSPILYRALDREWGMALITALMILLLSGGILSVRPRVGFMTRLTLDDAGGRLLRRLLPAILLIPVAALALSRIARGGDIALTTLAGVLAVVGMALAALFVYMIAGTIARQELLQARYAQLVESTSDAIINTDCSGVVLQWNPAAERMYGHPAAEMLGRYVMKVVPLPDRRRLAEMRTAVVEHGERRVFEGLRLRRDGTTFFGSTTLSPIVDSLGKTVGIAAVTRDMTLRRAFERVDEATQAIAAVQADLPHDLPSVLRAIVAQASSLTLAQGAGLGIIVDPERPFSPWVEVSSDVKEGMPPSRRAPRPGHLEEDRPDLTGGLAVPIHFRGRLLGKLYLVSRRAFSVVDAFVARLFAERAGAAIEIARAHGLAVEERARLATVIDQLPDPFILIDADGRVAQMNRAALALATQGPPDGFGNQTGFDLRRPTGEALSFEERPLTRALRRREGTRNLETVILDGRGARTPFLINCAPVYGATGEVIGAVEVAQDISAMKELERLREEWTAIVAHDLRQPVSVIRLTARTVEQRTSLEPPVRDAVARIDRATRQLERMIDDLLDLSQLEAHRLVLDRRPVELNQLVADVVRDLAPVTASHPVALRLTDEPLLCSVDAGRIRQALGNLLSNAVKYSPPASEITVEVSACDSAATFSVRNLGRGIPPDQLVRLFARFSRSDDTRRNRVPGLGLGLFITKGIVEAHGGQVAVESVPGESTVFTVTLPLATGATADRHP